MPKLLLRNTREHTITLSLAPKPDPKAVPGTPQPEAAQVVVPAANLSGEKPIHGQVEVDGSFIETVKRAHPVVQHYFKTGWLYVDDSATQKTLSASELEEAAKRADEETERLRKAAAQQGNK